MTKVLITGGAGYIGTMLTQELLRKEYAVIVLDNLSQCNAQSIIPFFRNKQYHFINGDIREEKVQKEALKKADVICHLAGIVGYPACARQPHLSYDVNVAATAILDKLRSPRQPLINAGSGSVYGRMPEGIRYCSEIKKINPASIYGTHKAEAEKILMDTGNAVSLRLATAFGLSQRLRLDLLVNDFCYQAVHTGKLVIYESHFKRTFIHVYDIAQAFIHSIENFDRMKNEIYNCGDRKLNLQKIQVAELIKGQHDLSICESANGKDEDSRNYNMSFKKINDTGFHTSVSMKQGIKELLSFFSAATKPLQTNENPAF